MVLHHVPGGGILHQEYGGASSDPEQVDMGASDLGEGARGVSREGAAEARHRGRVRWGAALQHHPCPPCHSSGREDDQDVGVHRPHESRLSVAGADA
jgi:hypothetical protein